MASEITATPGRVCLVTVGATVPFRRLLEEVLDQNFIDAMEDMGFKTMYLQTHADDANWALNASRSIRTRVEFKIYPYFSPAALRHVVGLCRGKANEGTSGVVIAHGGSGTVTEVRRLEAPLVLRANSSLADDHQHEVIDEAVERGWAFEAKPGDLQDAVSKALMSVESDLAGRTDTPSVILNVFLPTQKPRIEAMVGKWMDECKAAMAEGE